MYGRLILLQNLLIRRMDVAFLVSADFNGGKGASDLTFIKKYDIIKGEA